mgnify:FL=1
MYTGDIQSGNPKLVDEVVKFIDTTFVEFLTEEAYKHIEDLQEKGEFRRDRKVVRDKKTEL